MKINNGSLTYEDYYNLCKNRNIVGKSFKLLQIQPSSIDLTLSNEGYEICASFLSESNFVRENLKVYFPYWEGQTPIEDYHPQNHHSKT